MQDVIEPLLKPQWWVDCKQMAADGCEAVRDGRLEIIPAEFESTWFRWLEVSALPLLLPSSYLPALMHTAARPPESAEVDITVTS